MRSSSGVETTAGAGGGTGGVTAGMTLDSAGTGGTGARGGDCGVTVTVGVWSCGKMLDKGDGTGGTAAGAGAAGGTGAGGTTPAGGSGVKLKPPDG